MRLGTVADLDQTSSEMARIWSGSVRNFVLVIFQTTVNLRGRLSQARAFLKSDKFPTYCRSRKQPLSVVR